VLGGALGAPRDVVLLNAGVGLFVAGHSTSVREGIASAAEAIDTGAALKTLASMTRGSHAEAGA
jgi:anthranilate phosphoribosyltransferase